jgi:hypothetical protein
MKQTPLQRIRRVMDYYYRRGINREKVNNIYRKLLAEKYKQKKTLIDIMQFDEKIGMYDSKYYENQFKVKDYAVQNRER